MSLFTSSKCKASMLLLTTVALCNRYVVKDACVYTSCSPYLHGVAALKLTRCANLHTTARSVKTAAVEPQVPSQYTAAAQILSAIGYFPKEMTEAARDGVPAVLMGICPEARDVTEVITCYKLLTGEIVAAENVEDDHHATIEDTTLFWQNLTDEVKSRRQKLLQVQHENPNDLFTLRINNTSILFALSETSGADLFSEAIYETLLSKFPTLPRAGTDMNSIHISDEMNNEIASIYLHNYIIKIEKSSVEGQAHGAYKILSDEDKLLSCVTSTTDVGEELSSPLTKLRDLGIELVATFKKEVALDVE